MSRNVLQHLVESLQVASREVWSKRLTNKKHQNLKKEKKERNFG